MSGILDEAQRISQTTEKKDGSECNECSDFTAPDTDLCLSCRRKERGMTYSSPDVALDGSIKTTESDNESPNSTSDDSPNGILPRILSVLNLR